MECKSDLFCLVSGFNFQLGLQLRKKLFVLLFSCCFLTSTHLPHSLLIGVVCLLSMRMADVRADSETSKILPSNFFLVEDELRGSP